MVERLLFLPKHRQRVIAELGHPETLFQLLGEIGGIGRIKPVD